MHQESLKEHSHVTPLKVLNLYLSNGHSTGPEGSWLYRQFDSIITWDWVLHRAIDLAPLLYHILTTAGPSDDLKGPVRDSLKSLYKRQLVRHLVQFNELDDLLQAFDEEAVEVIVLKGADLAFRFYPMVALRPMLDIDLLVREHDIERAEAILRRQGYEFHHTRYEQDRDFWRTKYIHIPYVKQDTDMPVKLDLHFDIEKKGLQLKADVEDFWKHAVPLNGLPNVFCLTEELLLLYLLWHSYRHLYKELHIRLSWWLDMAFVLKKSPEIDLIAVREMATGWGIYNHASLYLNLLAELFELEVKERIKETFPLPGYKSRIFGFIISRSINKPLKRHNSLYEHILNMLTMHSISESMRYAFAIYRQALQRRQQDIVRGSGYSKAYYILFLIHPLLFAFNTLKWFTRLTVDVIRDR